MPGVDLRSGLTHQRTISRRSRADKGSQVLIGLRSILRAPDHRPGPAFVALFEQHTRCVVMPWHTART